MSVTKRIPFYTLLQLPDAMALLACTPDGICALSLDDSAESLERGFLQRWPIARKVAGASSGQHTEAGERLLVSLLPRVQAMLNGAADPQAGQPWPLDLQGTPFQLAVWRALREIPAGSTCSYAELATRLGRPSAARAVASACAANAVAVLVPCHRVVRADGSLSGYRWGVTRKQALLAAEAAGASGV